MKVFICCFLSQVIYIVASSIYVIMIVLIIIFIFTFVFSQFNYTRALYDSLWDTLSILLLFIISHFIHSVYSLYSVCKMISNFGYNLYFPSRVIWNKNITSCMHQSNNPACTFTVREFHIECWHYYRRWIWLHPITTSTTPTLLWS